MLPDRDECHCFALRQAARRVTQLYDAHLAKAGLRATQFSLLAKLNRHKGVSIVELAEVMVMDRTTLGRAIRPLERDKLLTIGPGEDGRTRALCLTEAGEARLAQASALWREAQKEYERAFGREPAVELRGALRRVASAL